jgi:Glyoxalase-like domain
MRLRIDHVTIAGSRLDPLQLAFAEAGLTTDYGGPHSNNITHMALLGFDDGSYIELISTLKPGQHSPWWDAHIRNDGGPCAWALEVDDVAAETRRVAGLGVAVHGPTHYARERPDGVTIEWDLAILGDQGMGALLPFIIKDRTPRELRVSPSPSVAGTALTGVALVVIAVPEMEPASELFQRVYELPLPVISEWLELGARFAHFPGQPFALAAPLASDNWLAQRLARFGVSPCAYLIGSSDMVTTAKRLPLTRARGWRGRSLAWLTLQGASHLRVGVIDV